MPSTQFWDSATYGNGKFVAISGGPFITSNVAAYSTDGINWHPTALLPSAYLITYGNGKFVVIGVVKTTAAAGTVSVLYNLTNFVINSNPN